MKLGNIILESRVDIDTDACCKVTFDGINPLSITRKYQRLLLIDKENYCKYFAKTFDLNGAVTRLVRTIIPSTPRLCFNVINTHGSSTLDYTANQLLTVLIPKIGRYFDIKKLEWFEAGEGQFFVISLTKLKELKHYSSILVRLDGATLKFQLSRQRTSVSCTFIFSSWDRDNLDLFYFMSGMASLASNVSDLVKNLTSTLKEHENISKSKNPSDIITTIISDGVEKVEVIIVQTELRIVSKEGGEKFVKRMGENLLQQCALEWSTENHSSHIESQCFYGGCAGARRKIVIKNSTVTYEEMDDIMLAIQRKIDELQNKSKSNKIFLEKT